MSVSESGAVRAWILAFILMAGLGIGALVGVGCLVGANVCPGGSKSKETSTNGMQLYVARCSFCHGPKAAGAQGLPGPSLVSGPLGALPIDQLEAKISKGKPLGGMPRFRDDLTAAQIHAIAEHIVGLRGGG